MQLKHDQLGRSLGDQLAPVYLIAGDETLLVEEAAEAVLSSARASGFGERTVLHADTGFSWQSLIHEAASLSLFSERKIIDLRNPATKFDKEASAVLREYCQAPDKDTMLVIRCGRLEGRQRQSAWFKALDAVGVVVLVWPVAANELPRWLNTRLGRMGLSFEPDAVDYLAERVEGNLLAAVGELVKLDLADVPQPVTLVTLVEALEDATHYDTFELLDAVYIGDQARVSRMLRGLRDEGVALFAILGALGAQLRQITVGRVPPFRRRLTDQLLRRLGSTEALDRVLAQCALVDQQGKGQLLGDAWISLENLLLRLAGAKLPSLETQLDAMRRL